MKKTTTTPAAAKIKHRYYKAVYYRTDGSTRTIHFQEAPEAPTPAKPHKRAAKPAATKTSNKRRTVKRA